MNALAQQSQLKPLRPFQAEGVRKVLTHFDNNQSRVLAVAPPGAGKTVIATHVVSALLRAGERALIIAHRREIIDQTSRTLADAGIGHGIIMGNDERTDSSQRVQVATIQSLRSRLKTNPEAGLVIIDEAHLGVADSYLQVIDNCYRDSKILGLTGTPERLDGKGLDRVFSELVVIATSQSLVDQGFLVPMRVLAPADRPDLSRVSTLGGDYNVQQLDELMNTATLCGDIVQHYITHAYGLPAIAFAVSKEHSRSIADAFLHAGIVAEHVDCDTSVAERTAIFGRLRNGTTKVVCNVDICTEGFDFPELRCVILARPTKSWARCMQAMGRGMRIAAGKKEAICLDHAGCVYEHGFPTDPVEITLQGVNSVAANEMENCPKCKAVIRKSASKCVCGWVRPPPPANDDKERGIGPRVAENDDGELKELKPEDRLRCASCGSYRGRTRRLGHFTHMFLCHKGCRPSYQTDAAAVANATAQQKVDELVRLRGCGAAWGEAWIRRKFRDTFGHFPTGVA